MKHYIESQNGNVLWFVLITIALFGLLSVVLSRNSASVNQSGDAEKARIKATQIMRYASGLESAIEKLRITNGCSENDISFDNTDVTGYENLNSPADKSCHVFDAYGGGMTYEQPKDNWLDDAHASAQGYEDLFFTATAEVTGIGTDCGNAACMDLILFVPYLRRDVCLAINRVLDNVPAYSGNPPANDGTIALGDAEKFIGSFNSNNVLEGTSSGRSFAGLNAACIEDNGNGGGSGEYFYYHVLLTR